MVGISTFTMAAVRIRRPRIKPTSISLRSARRLNVGRGYQLSTRNCDQFTIVGAGLPSLIIASGGLLVLARLAELDRERTGYLRCQLGCEGSSGHSRSSASKQQRTRVLFDLLEVSQSYVRQGEQPLTTDTSLSTSPHVAVSLPRLIDEDYNGKGLHSARGHRSPVKFE